MLSMEIEQSVDYLLWKSLLLVMDEDPCVEMLTPIGQGAIEVVVDFLKRPGDNHPGLGGINLKQRPARWQIPIASPVTDVSPRFHRHEVARVPQPHDAREPVLELRPVLQEEIPFETHFVVGSGDGIHELGGLRKLLRTLVSS